MLDGESIHVAPVKTHGPRTLVLAMMVVGVLSTTAQASRENRAGRKTHKSPIFKLVKPYRNHRSSNEPKPHIPKALKLSLKKGPASFLLDGWKEQVFVPFPGASCTVPGGPHGTVHQSAVPRAPVVIVSSRQDTSSPKGKKRQYVTINGAAGWMTVADA